MKSAVMCVVSVLRTRNDLFRNDLFRIRIDLFRVRQQMSISRVPDQDLEFLYKNYNQSNRRIYQVADIFLFHSTVIQILHSRILWPPQIRKKNLIYLAGSGTNNSGSTTLFFLVQISSPAVHFFLPGTH